MDGIKLYLNNLYSYMVDDKLFILKNILGRFSEPATAFDVDRPRYQLSTTKATLGIADAGELKYIFTVQT